MSDPRVFIPYREDSPERAESKASSKRFFESLGLYVSYIDSEAGLPFNRGEARNRCVDEALKNNTSVVIICDVDCRPEPFVLAGAANAAEATGGLHYPFRVVRINHRDGDSHLEAGHDGGCFVVRPEEWRSVLGCPELYSWGWEDKILLSRYRTWIGMETRHPGVLDHRYHPGSEHTLGHLELCKRYEAVIGNQWDLEELEYNDAIWDDAHTKDGSRRSRPEWQTG